MSARVSVIGGTGFIGRRLVELLLARGASVRIVSRHALDAAPVSPHIERVGGSIEDASTIERAVAGVFAVVNLVGTTSARSEQQFYSLHRDSPRRLARAARLAGVRRFVHVSAMGVALDAPSLADRSKAAGEIAVRDAFPDANLIRPALAYGAGDHFFTRFAELVRKAPAIPLIGGGRTRFQPIHVDDLARSLARLLERDDTPGRAYDLGSSEIFTLREMIEQLCRALGRAPRLVPIPFPIAEALARATERLPHAPLTLDQVRLLRTDKVIRLSALQNGPAALGVEPRPLASFLAELASVQAGSRPGLNQPS